MVSVSVTAYLSVLNLFSVRLQTSITVSLYSVYRLELFHGVTSGSSVLAVAPTTVNDNWHGCYMYRQLDVTPDDVLTAHNEFDVLRSLPDSPTSASAMLTFADIVAASTVKTWSDGAERGRRRCAEQPDDSSSSSDGSTVTATTVRTVVAKSNNVPETEHLGVSSSERNSVTSTPRSASRPASSRVRQLTTAANPRSRSVSQPRSESSASKVVPTGPRSVQSRSTRPSRQSRQ